MTQDTRPRQDISFVLRLWLEPAAGRSPEWRWQVHHVQSGEDHYFSSLADVLEFVARCGNVSPPQISTAGMTRVGDRVAV